MHLEEGLSFRTIVAQMLFAQEEFSGYRQCARHCAGFKLGTGPNRGNDHT